MAEKTLEVLGHPLTALTGSFLCVTGLALASFLGLKWIALGCVFSGFPLTLIYFEKKEPTGASTLEFFQGILLLGVVILISRSVITGSSLDVLLILAFTAEALAALLSKLVASSLCNSAEEENSHLKQEILQNS